MRQKRRERKKIFTESLETAARGLHKKEESTASSIMRPGSCMGSQEAHGLGKGEEDRKLPANRNSEAG